MNGLATAQRRGRLLKTGQTTAYGIGSTADDGYHEKGLAKAYDVLTSGQYSGTTNITINAKTDAHSNNCVVDKVTGLMWSRYASASVGPTSNGLLPWTTNGSGEGVFTYAAAANSASLAGHTDWRVPNIFELYSLCDFEATTAAPDSTAFPSFSTSSSYYTSTTGPNLTTGAIFMQFSGGAVSRQDKALTGLVLLVRGG